VNRSRDDNTPVFRPALHASAWALAVAIFPLVWMGGLVTSHGAGMAVPDWPNSFGYNMFALPFSQWLSEQSGGVFYEHFHRLLGTVAGLMAIVFVAQTYGTARHPDVRRLLRINAIGWLGAAAFCVVGLQLLKSTVGVSEVASKSAGHMMSGFGALGTLSLALWTGQTRDPRKWLRRISMTLLVCIVIQGLLGGFRVTESSLLLAKIHGIFGQLVFAFAATTIVFTSKWWLTRATAHAPVDRSARVLAKLAHVCMALIAIQLVLGALMRHDPRRNPTTGDGAGLSIPDWPLHYGRIIPPMKPSDLGEVNRIRTTQYQLPALQSIGSIHLQFTHRIGAYLTALTVLVTCGYALRKAGPGAGLVWPSVLLVVLVLAQVSFGVLTVLWRKPADVATAHQATGAMLLAMSTILFVRARREYAARLLPGDAVSTSGSSSAAAKHEPVVPAIGAST
jgi:cytochrome c oxidase assembly protein subunit 15